MSASFDISIVVVLQNEGGLVDNPADPGGLTNFGISQRAYPNLDIRHLTVDQAKQIYYRDYWKFSDLMYQNVATKCLDVVVNMGVPGGTKLIQEALIDLGGKIQADGVWGPKTESTLNGFTESEALQEIRVHQTTHYVNLVAQNPSDYQFLRTWLRRVQSC